MTTLPSRMSSSVLMIILTAPAKANNNHIGLSIDNNDKGTVVHRMQLDHTGSISINHSIADAPLTVVSCNITPFVGHLMFTNVPIIIYIKFCSPRKNLAAWPVTVMEFHRSSLGGFDDDRIALIVIDWYHYATTKGLVRLSKEDVNPPTQNTHWD